eukprot:scaffold400068_cov30-Prasinocladus_malaysianus.AAC.1
MMSTYIVCPCPSSERCWPSYARQAKLAASDLISIEQHPSLVCRLKPDLHRDPRTSISVVDQATSSGLDLTWAGIVCPQRPRSARDDDLRPASGSPSDLDRPMSLLIWRLRYNLD